MFPDQCHVYSPYTLLPSTQNLFTNSLFQFGYPYYLPLSVFPQNQVHHMFQNSRQNKQIQNHPKRTSKASHSDRIGPICDMKKKQVKNAKMVPQASNGAIKETKNNLDFGQQKEGRNANSNLLRMFFRRLEFKFDFEEERMRKVWSKFNFKTTISDFVDWIHEAKIDYRNYIRVPTVKKLFRTDSKHREHSQILRVLLKDFLDGESLCCYLTSRKIKRDSMPYNFRSIRTIYEELFSQDQKSASA